MSLENHKITTYEDNVKNLDDYPKLSATELKAVFDGRGDKEIKEKHNALIDELEEEFEGVKTHHTDIAAHSELFDALREEVSDEMPKNLSELNDDIGLGGRIGQHEGDFGNPHNVTAAQVGLDKVNNTPDSEKRVAHAETATSAECDITGKKISDTYATKEEAGSKLEEAKTYTDDLELRLTEADDGNFIVNYAEHAGADVDGNWISDTYATKSEASSKFEEAKAYTDDLEKRLGTNTYANVDPYVNWAYYCEEANIASMDWDGNWISDTYATKEELQSAVSSLSISVVDADEPTLKVGNTQITETQLQSLLELLTE